MEADGKVNGKYPIYNDLLCFLWCKMKFSPRDILLNVIKQYYKAEQVVKARDEFDLSVPSKEGE